MALLSDWWLLDLLTVVSGLLGVLYLYYATVCTYWKKRGVPYLEPSFPFGSLGAVMLGKSQMGVVFSDIYFRLKNHKVGGVFQLHSPTLVLRDLDVIKRCLIKDFAHFHDHGFYFDEENDPLSAHLFHIGGQKWKNLRAKLTPTFSSGKMKMMFQTILDCGLELTECAREEAKLGQTIDLKELIARYTTDVISSCAFGVEGNCLKDPNAEFRRWGKVLLAPGFVLRFGLFLNAMVPNVAAIVKLGRVPTKTSDRFRQMIKDNIDHREKNNITRKDLLQLMIQLKNKGYVEEELGDSADISNNDAEGLLKQLTLNELTAQAFVFFVAGFETSSATVSFCVYELALKPGVQTRLREEMDAVLGNHGGSLTYDAMQDMKYLDMVVAETLRKYPAVPILNRECTKSITLDDGLVVETGTPVVVPVLGIHHDPMYYPDPENFDPERFTPEQKAARQHCAYMPFGEGPRFCIGMRFAYVQIKVALISLLTRYEFDISEKTSSPMVFDPFIFTLRPNGGLFLKISNRK